MADGTGGTLVDSTEQTADALVALLRDRDRAEQLGREGRARVYDHFLLPRLLLNELVLLNELAGNPPTGVRQDPVCGLVLDPEQETPTVEEHGVRHAFCSNDCRRRFLTRGLEWPEEDR